MFPLFPAFLVAFGSWLIGGAKDDTPKEEALKATAKADDDKETAAELADEAAQLKAESERIKQQAEDEKAEADRLAEEAARKPKVVTPEQEELAPEEGFAKGGKVKGKKKGGIDVGAVSKLAIEIRHEGEKWTDAIKRASAKIKEDLSRHK